MKKLFTFLLLGLFVCTANAQVIKTVNVTTAGTLATVASTYLSTVTNLTVTGSIDARDFLCMRESMTNLKVIDLKTATIKSYTGTAGTVSGSSTTYPVNEIPQYSFFNISVGIGKTGLTSISLPITVSSIGSSAFQGCIGLTLITNNNSSPPIVQDVYSFKNIDKTICKVNVPVGTVLMYKATTFWKDFSNIVDGTPITTTLQVNCISTSTASSGGNITNQGDATVSAKGICWSTTSSPTLANNKTIDGNGIGIFSSTMTGLSVGTLYYARAYATNSIGTGYGEELNFKLSLLPTLTTNNGTSISATSVLIGGNITNIGTSSVLARGVCWSTSANPTITNNKTNDGTGLGSFSSSITGLSLGTTYHVRAYASNNEGTAYGSDISFTTLANSTEVYLNNIAFISSAQDALQTNVPTTLTMNTKNPNNFVNPGNLVRFKMQCFNKKINGANIVSGSCKVRCKDPNLVLTDSTSGLNNVAWNGSAWSSDEFEIQIKPNTSIGYVAYVDFVVIEGSNTYFTYQVPIPIAPLSLQSKTVDDDNNPDSKGNSNGICEPNEIIETLPSLQNSSTLSANYVSGTFSNYYSVSGINVWNNKQGSSGMVVNNSYWNFAYNIPQVITAGAKDMVPQWDFVFDYNLTKTYRFTLGLTMSGTFQLFSGYKSYIKWLIPVDYNVGHPDFNTGVDKTLIENLNVFPNPSNGRFTLNIGSDFENNCTLSLTNTFGQKVYVSKLVIGKLTIDLRSFNFKGIYFLQLYNQNGFLLGERKMVFK